MYYFILNKTHLNGLNEMFLMFQIMYAKAKIILLIKVNLHFSSVVL